MSARVLRAEIERREIPLARPIRNARGTWTSRRGLLLCLHGADGRVGLGEATPLPGYSPDDADDCARALARACAALPDDETAHERAACAVPELAALPALAELTGLPCARFALETALLDLRAQRRGVSLAALLAGTDALRPLPRSGLVDLASPALEDDARALVARGVRTVKAKLLAGDPPSLANDCAALERLRAAVGSDVRIRLDANGALGSSARLAELARVRPELVEEPVSGAALASLGACEIPWAADESLQSTAMAESLLDSPCAAFVIKPALLGFHAARALALRAIARGKHVIVTHLFDGPVALAAACELALSLPRPPRGEPLAQGLDLHPGLALWDALLDSPVIPQLPKESGLVVPHAGAGLGVS